MSSPLFQGLSFAPIARPKSMLWGSLPDFRAILPVLALPIADTELLNLSHYAPVGVHIPEGEAALPTVVLLLHPLLARPLPFDDKGKWLPPYQPLTLRCLPFTPDARGQCLFAPGLVVSSQAPSWRIETDKGQPSTEFRQIRDQVNLLFEGSRRLANAARLLLAADVLVPILPIPEQGQSRLLVVSGERLAALSPQRAAGLTALGMLPMELAAASLFSRRYLHRRLDPSVDEGMVRDPFTFAPRAEMIEPLPPDLLAGRYELDSGSLFNFDAFQGSVQADP